MVRINNQPPRIKVIAKLTAVTEQSDLFKKLLIKLDKLNEKISRANETQAALLAKKEDHDKTITKLEKQLTELYCQNSKMEGMFSYAVKYMGHVHLNRLN